MKKEEEVEERKEKGIEKTRPKEKFQEEVGREGKKEQGSPPSLPPPSLAQTLPSPSRGHALSSAFLPYTKNILRRGGGDE